MDRGKRVAVTGALWVAADAEPAAGPVELETVMVTATKTEHTVFEVAGSVSMVAAETIEAEQPQSLNDILKALPNIELFSGPRHLGEEANVHGFSDGRIITILDGARQNFSVGHQGRLVLEPDLTIELSHPPRRWADDVEGGGAFAAVKVTPIRRWGRCIACLLLALVGPVQSAQVVDAMGQQVAVTDASRIVTVGGELTEIVYALGAGERLAGVDTTSTWPEAAR